ncbi:hypothetical protein P692DRAFT_201364969 [Suillus brevipes Sb2]|nr:hypothetical protein P692DRAFT_201364969 [Suillus brevipes Sb2]
MISSTTMTTTITPHINTSPSPPSPGPSNKTLPPAVPAAPSPITPAPTTNAKRMRPGPNKNGRTLCAHRWLNGVAKDGTTADFKIYWTALPKDAKKKYELEAAQLVSGTSALCRLRYTDLSTGCIRRLAREHGRYYPQRIEWNGLLIGS